jgi:guanylate kinase
VRSDLAVALWHDYQRRGGLLFVLSGPSGVGKDRLLGEFLRIAPNVRRCVTTTTRLPRNGERDGADYWFLPMPEFRRMVDAGEFLEHAEVHGHLYGVQHSHVEELLAEGRDVILLIDVQGAATVKRWRPDATMVFLVPPSMEELERRLRERGTESENEIVVRLADARAEFERVSEFDYMIVHDRVEDAARKLAAIVAAERCRIERSV